LGLCLRFTPDDEVDRNIGLARALILGVAFLFIRLTANFFVIFRFDDVLDDPMLFDCIAVELLFFVVVEGDPLVFVVFLNVLFCARFEVVAFDLIVAFFDFFFIVEFLTLF
jgi:hypothetical protein